MGFGFNIFTGGTFNPSGVLKSIYGSKPSVPSLPEVTLSEEQQKAIKANIEAVPQASKFAGLLQQEIRDMANFFFPGFDTASGQVASNISSLLRGEIPTDVSQAVKRSGAAEALAGGYGGTGMARNLVARDLGLTSLGLTQQGLSSAEGWLAAMEQLYSPSQALFSGMFITPQQELAAATQERDHQFHCNWLVNQIAAMPDPVARGLFDITMELVGDVLSIYSGGQKHQSYYGGGGGGGMGGGGGGGLGLWGWGAGADTGALSGGTGALGGGMGSALGGFI